MTIADALISSSAITSSLRDYFCCPPEISDIRTMMDLSGPSAFFQFGPEVTCYGQHAGDATSNEQGRAPFDALCLTRLENMRVELPFDLDQVVNNLRHERYVADRHRNSHGSLTGNALTRRTYYFLRPLLSVSLRKYLQRARLHGWEGISFPRWPVDFSVDSLMMDSLALILRSGQTNSMPFIWFWPDGIPSCAIVTHDVEEAAGRDFCHELMNLDDQFSIKSSFQIIPEARYETHNGLLEEMRSRGFEINVHDLNHDGLLFAEQTEFTRRVKQINHYGKRFGAEGFRSGAMYRNQDWYGALDFSYDMSVPNVAHLEPQRGGCCTVMPYFIGEILELPLTAIQDYTLFHILSDFSIRRWRQQIELITQRNGLVSFIAHPDYLIEKRARDVYVELLHHLARLRDENRLWLPLPRDVNRWWRNRRNMRLVQDGDKWRIEGPDSKRAKLAYATLQGDRVVCSIAS